ncbi:MAG: hypothetical protein JWR51_4743 [Devosia sp.]|uniref:hypothetical protein n=1 Tax=Devosia sp. TaxID=1871048 RepID=UPI002602E08D|nr:hypothetical protein [Devosia sp.]MDB5531640.1 hypothetical protein [Devosia sp.]
MGRHWKLSHIAVLLLAGLGGGCAVPAYDVPRDDYGQPTVKTIVERIQCEIRDMVRTDRPQDPASFNRLMLLNGDYRVLVALSLEVNDSGGLSPSAAYITPWAPAATFSANLNGTLSEARNHTFTANIELSTRQIYLDWKNGIKPYDCPVANTNLAGELGLKDIVNLAASAPNLADESKSDGKSIFGGTVQFVVTKSISATGPSWQLVRFKNLAALANLSEVNTDKIILNFVPGSDKGKRLPQGAVNSAAYQLLQQQLLNSINSQLILQNTPR